MSSRQRRLCDVPHAQVRSPGHALQVLRSPHTNRKSRGVFSRLTRRVVIASAVNFCGGFAFDEQVEIIGADVPIEIRGARWPTHLDLFSLSGAPQAKMQT